jgi:hypothetical protein
MDALARADEALARARTRAHVVTPEDATSPMDAAATVQIPRRMIDAIDRQAAESTMIITPDWGPRASHD